jgi:hypothetical protein
MFSNINLKYVPVHAKKAKGLEVEIHDFLTSTLDEDE